MGLEIWKNHDGIFVGQGKYTITILKKICMMECKSMDTPTVMNLKKIQYCGSDLIDPSMYHKFIVSLNYLENTWPDICYDVNTLSQYLVEPWHVHWVSMKHILGCLNGTIEYGLRYVSNGEWKLHGITNVD